MKILDWIQKEGGISTMLKKLSRAVWGKSEEEKILHGGSVIYYIIFHKA
jgi:hypothetical protein